VGRTEKNFTTGPCNPAPVPEQCCKKVHVNVHTVLLIVAMLGSLKLCAWCRRHTESAADRGIHHHCRHTLSTAWVCWASVPEKRVQLCPCAAAPLSALARKPASAALSFASASAAGGQRPQLDQPLHYNHSAQRPQVVLPYACVVIRLTSSSGP